MYKIDVCAIYDKYSTLNFFILQVHWKKEENNIFTTLKLKYPGVHYITKKKYILTDENVNQFNKEETRDDDNEIKEEFKGYFHY